MITIPAVLECCAGIDIGKKNVAVALLKGPADREAEITTREFGTTVPALQAMKEWLVKEGCRSVAMESTGSYWIPVKTVIEDAFAITLVCARKHRTKKGDKTDFRDAIHSGHSHRYGLLTGSYLPEGGIVELRDLTRRRKKLLGNLASEKNRIQKVLETATVKIGNVVSDVFGVSGQSMVKALLSKREMEASEIADLAKNRLRTKIPELTETLQGHQMNDHHRWLIEQSVEHIVLLDRQVEKLEDRIEEKIKPYGKQYELLQTLPGVKAYTAASVLAEIGAEMQQFATADHLCSWAGICPGNNRSAGKSKSSHIKKANKFLLATLVEASWGAVHTRGSVFERKYRKWAIKLGKKRATIAISRALLRTMWAILKEGRPYREPNRSEIQELERKSKVLHCGTQLRKLGADAAVVEQMVQQVLSAKPPEAGCSIKEPEESTPQQTEPQESGGTQSTPTGGPAQRPQPCRGALGFRARQTREQYSVFKHPPGGRSLQSAPKVKREARAKPVNELQPRATRPGAKKKALLHIAKNTTPSEPPH